MLQLDFDHGKKQYPFKFNPSWLKNDDFNVLVKYQWGILQNEVLCHFSSMNSLLFKLDKLCSLVRSWEVDTNKKVDFALSSIEEAIHLVENDLGVVFSVQIVPGLSKNYSCRSKIFSITRKKL